MRRAALAGALAVAAGCGGGGPGPAPAPSAAPRPPTDQERIATALERRAGAIERRVRDLGVRAARYEVERVRVRGRRARVTARLAYRVAGVKGTFGSQRVLRARKRRGEWRVGAPRGARSAEPWEVDDYERVRTPHFVVWVPDGLTAPVEALEAGYARLGEVLEADELRRRYLVVVARDGAAARRITRDITGLESLTALTDTQISVEGRALRVAEVRSQRLITVASTFGLLDAAGHEQVITHELAHAVLAPRTSARTPSWLTEGVALYLSTDDRREEYFALPTVPTLAGLAAPDAVGRLDGELQGAAYATASAAAFFIADRYGEQALLDLLKVFNRADLRGRRGDPALTDRALRRTLGVGLDELQRTLG